ncbi:PepSY-associated TM helix domain-containing protein [Rhizosaccharibacter radicis]|uniref:PepSY domain-containing protein n=1 Tax=Rhizosaccharibacter radicis TaxID=2782605 RepID=A0ABT1VUM7_9PROT|nr:PepSY domain-containing protein [Acetobacteraceae bacterium KSS12]
MHGSLPPPGAARFWPRRHTLWRWHFYAGLFCIPFVLMLSVTGMIYLFKPQIDGWIDRPFDRLPPAAHPGAPSAEVAAALRMVPGGRLLAFELPHAAGGAPRVLVQRGSTTFRAYVDPRDLSVPKLVREDRRFERLVFRLHGQLLMGNGGSLVVELAASWCIVMILTGLCLWWPRPDPTRHGPAGLLLPRLGPPARRFDRRFWRELHGASGFWASGLLLFLLISGLPWAYGWGSLLQEARDLAAPRAATAAARASPDWQVGNVPAGVEIAGAATPVRGDGPPPAADADASMADMPGMGGMAGPAPMDDGAALDAVVPAAARLHLAEPVLITPPARPGGSWTARSDSQNRLLRDSASIDAEGRVTARLPFSGRPLLDRVIGIGVAVHEGHLFGWANMVLNALAAVLAATLGVSSLVLWLGRRPAGRLGAPRPLPPRRVAIGFGMLVLLMGCLLPMFGASAVLVWGLDRLLLRRWIGWRRWLGVEEPEAPPPAG